MEKENKAGFLSNVLGTFETDVDVNAVITIPPQTTASLFFLIGSLMTLFFVFKKNSK